MPRVATVSPTSSKWTQGSQQRETEASTSSMTRTMPSSSWTMTSAFMKLVDRTRRCLAENRCRSCDGPVVAATHRRGSPQAASSSATGTKAALGSRWQRRTTRSCRCSSGGTQDENASTPRTQSPVAATPTSSCASFRTVLGSSGMTKRWSRRRASRQSDLPLDLATGGPRRQCASADRARFRLPFGHGTASARQPAVPRLHPRRWVGSPSCPPCRALGTPGMASGQAVCSGGARTREYRRAESA